MKLYSALLLCCTMLIAKDVTFNRELIAPAEIKFDFDNSRRAYKIKPAIGFEILTRRSDDYGDFLLENYQVRFSYDVTEETPKKSWAVELHNFWWEFKLNLGKRVRVGHFQPHFGVESSLNTHGKFFQTLAMKSMGMKHDWGISHTRYFGILDFATSLSLGNGMSIHPYDNTFLGTMRLSSPDREIFRGGISIMYGKTVTAMGMKTFPQPPKMGTLRRALFGLDGRYRGLRNTLLFETYLGAIEEKLAMGLLLRSEIPVKESGSLLLQGNGTYDGYKSLGRSELQAQAGFNYNLLKNLTLETQAGVTYNYSTEKTTPIVKMQLYYFGE